MIKSSEIISFETLTKDPNEGGPTLDDLEQGRVFIDKEPIKNVENLLQKHSRCLIRGAEGRGKTVLARVIAYNKYKDKWVTRYSIKYEEEWIIRFIDVREIREENINNIYAQLEHAVNDERTLIIVENAHSSSDKITPVLIQFAEEHKDKVFFIFTSRKIFTEEHQLSTDPFEEWLNKGWYVDLEPGIEEACHIIETFISAEKIDYSITDRDKFWIEREFGKKNVNLRRLKWYLDTWKKEWKEKSSPLHSVEEKEVIKEVRRHYHSELEGNVNLKEMLYNIAGVFKFDVNFYGGGYDKVILNDLKTRTSIITSMGGDYYGDYYRLQHSSDADYIIKAIAEEKQIDPSAITIYILKEYLKKKPLNYYELINALYLNKEKNILSKIFEDQETYKAIFDKIKDENRIRVVASVLGFLTWACGKEKGLEFWSQYKGLCGNSPEEQKKKLKDKLTDAPLVEINSLLASMSNVDDNEKDWLANEVLEKDVLVQKAQVKDTSFSNIVKLLELLPDEKKSVVISEFDPDVIAAKAKSSTAQRVMWFLRYCLLNPCSKDFANAFLLDIYKDGWLIEKLKKSNLSILNGCLSITKKLDPTIYWELNSKLSPHWLQIWLSSGLSIVANQLHRCRQSIGEPKEFAQSVIKNLASIDLSERIRRLYDQPGTKPLKVLGKLLNSSDQIAFETDKNAVEKIAQQIANNIDLKTHEKYTIEQLSLLVTNVKKCSELAWTKLCNRILSEVNLIDYISTPFDKGLAVLVWDIYQHNKEKGDELANKIFSLDFDKLLDSSDTEAVSRVLWNLLQIDDSKVKNWIQNIGGEKWLSKTLSSSIHDAFWLLWSLYHANEEKGRGATRLFADNILPSLTSVETKHLPLLGFFIFCDIQFDLNIPIPSLHEIAEKISEDLSLSEVAFYISFLKNKSDNLLKEFSKELGRQLFLKNLSFRIEEIMEKHPFEKTKGLLMEIFKDFDLVKEPNSTFTEMIYLTQAYLEEKKKNKVAFSQLRDFFLSNPTSDPIFKSKDDATSWLSIAIEYEIYNEEQVPHFRDPSRTVNLLSLNKDNRFFSSSLKGNVI